METRERDGVNKVKFLFLLLVALLAGGAGVAMRLRQVVTPNSGDIRENFQYDTASGAINILLIGVDETDQSHRADSLAVVRINVESRNIKVLSVPRDTRVQIPGHGWQKINHAFAFGGVELIQKTIINFLGIPLDYFAVINYDSFPRLVNLVGGIDLSVEKPLKYRDRSGGLHINIPAGNQHMDGQTALHYVRFRHDALGDIGRVQRQQKFLVALLKRIKEPRMLPRLPELAQQAVSMIDTNLTVSQAVQLAAYLKDLSAGNRLRFSTLPGSPAYISGISYWLPNLAEASLFFSEEGVSGDVSSPDRSSPSDLELSVEDISPASGDGTVETRSGIFPEQSEDSLESNATLGKIQRPVAVLNGNGGKGISHNFSKRLQELGIDVTYVGNAKHFDYHTSNILYPEGAPKEVVQSARALAELCGISPKLVRPDRKSTYATLILGHDYKNVAKKLGVDLSTK